MSGALNAVTSTLSAANGTVRAVTQLAGTASRAAALFGIDGFNPGGVLFGAADQLQAGSWRGQPFAVLASRVRAGRRKTVHEYPFRDGAWVEDLGKRGRVYGFEGFLLGDDVGEQMKAFVAAAEQAGPGELVHPTFGSRQVELLDFDAGDAWDALRVWSFRVEFLEGQPRGLQLLPNVLGNTQGQVGSAADAARDASSGSFLQRLGAGLVSGYTAVKQAIAAVKPYVTVAVQLAHDAGRVFGSVRTLVGSFGRYASGRAAALPGASGALRTTSQVAVGVSGALSAATRLGNSVVQAGSVLSRLVGP